MVGEIMGLTNETYFETDDHMSVSQWKKFDRCEYDATLPFDDSTKNPALLIGQYVDAYVEGTMDEFIKDNPELFTSRATDVQKKAIDWFKDNFSIHYDGFDELTKKDGDLKSNVSDTKLIEAIMNSEDALEDVLEEFPDFKRKQLKSEFKLAQDICDYIDSNERIKQFLSGEKQTIMTGEISNVPFKIKMDSYSKGIAISDLKVMRSVTDSNGEFYDFITPWGYDVQLACYQEIVYQNTGEKLPCYIVALTKETPINSVIIQIPQIVLDRALYRVESTIESYYEVKQGEREPDGCGTCKSCISNRSETPLISLMDIVEGI